MSLPYLVNPPQTFRVGGKRWKLSIGPLADCAGLTEYWDQVVALDNEQTPAEFLDTLMHELTHVINHAYGPLRPEDPHATDEHSAAIAGKGWSDLFITNPSLLRWIGVIAAEARKD